MLILKRPWTRQPRPGTRAVVGLFDAVVLPPVLVDAASGKPLIFTTIGGASFVPGIGGMAAQITGGPFDDLTVVSDSSTLLSTTEATIVWHGRSNPASTNGEFGEFSGTIACRCGAHVPFTDGTVYWDFGGADSGTTRLTASGLSFSELDVWAFTTGPRGMEIWQNGVLRASNTATPTRSSSSAGFGVGRHANGSGSTTSKTYGFAYSKRQLPSALLAQMTRSPGAMWGSMFPDRRIYIPSAAPAASTYTMSAATWTNLSASGVTPRVTVTVA